jgi:prepilin-type N-terminal cleavage/methylation domain-containing protein
MTSSRAQAAFTLIELLVTIAIILILIAIALPNFLSAQMRAKDVQCKSRLRVLGQALTTYKLDTRFFPFADGCGGPTASAGHTCPGEGPAALGSWDGVPWVLADLGYVADRETFYCPRMQGLFPESKDHVRYAYNSSAIDSGGASGGAQNLERDSGHLWVCRCCWLPAFATFDPGSGLIYPHGNDPVSGQVDVMENVLRINGVVESTNGLEDYNHAF